MGLLSRLRRMIHGFFSLFVSGMERRNPEALLEIEQENLRAEVARYNQGLASHAGLCERLMTQVKKLETEERDLRAKTAANLRAGNTQAAGEQALRLQTTTRELEENRTQVQQAEETYQALTKARDVAVAAARQKIEELKSSLNDLKVKKAMAELSAMSAGMNSELGGSGDTLNRLHDMVEDERAKAAGRARVAHDALHAGAPESTPGEQRALADQALAEFAAKEGLQLPPGSAASEIRVETVRGNQDAAEPKKDAGRLTDGE